MFRRLVSSICLVAAFCLASSVATADTVQVRDSASSSGYYVPGTGGSIRATYTGGSYNSINTGTFNLDADYGSGWESLVTYCSEPGQTVKFGTNPPDTVGLPYEHLTLGALGNFNTAEQDFLGKLWANAFADSTTSATKAAAFQSLVWELAVDDTLNLTSGNFKMSTSNSFTLSAIYVAASWANNILNNTWTASTDLSVLHHSKSQDYLVPRAIPEPSSLALAALGGLMLLPRRRRARAQA